MESDRLAAIWNSRTANVVTPANHSRCRCNKSLRNAVGRFDAFLCVNLSVLCVSAVAAYLHPLNRRDAEHAEAAQRRVSKKALRLKEPWQQQKN
jgi:hypothetical protein